MGQGSEPHGLLTAWRALQGSGDDGDGWRTINFASGLGCRVLAGRHYPGNEEGLLFGFASINVPASKLLPQGRGFQVSRVLLDEQLGRCTWIGLTRQVNGNIDLFTRMAADVIRTLETQTNRTEEKSLEVLLNRIRAWQHFMQRDSANVLHNEAEIGLFGELVLIRQLLESKLPPAFVIEGWKGPLDGLHDFLLGNAAIEVKATVHPVVFPAKIMSLEQLDDCLVSPLFLAAVRLTMDPNGLTLPEIVESVRTWVSSDENALELLNTGLLKVGYFDVFSDEYKRQFGELATRFILVNEEFPRLTRGTVPDAVRRASYELDLAAVPRKADLTLAEILSQIGVT